MGETQKKLAAGGIKKSEGRNLAIEMRVLRIETNDYYIIGIFLWVC
jgi:hypothetical protein